MHCRRFVDPPLSRRDMLLRCGSGFGALAAAALSASRPSGSRGCRGDRIGPDEGAARFERRSAGAQAASFRGQGARA